MTIREKGAPPSGEATTEKRSAQRTSVSLDVQVEGQNGSYAASTVDLSPVGALLWITDERFVPSTNAADMVRFSERVAQELADRMRVHFGAGALVVDAEVVRVTRKGRDDRGPMLVACRFTRTIRNEEWLAMGLDPKSAGSNGAAAEAAPAEAETASNEERRVYPRIERILYVEVQGDYGTYKAYALNVSRNGVLFTITDPQFAPPAEPDQLVLFTKKLGFQFRSGLIVRFLEADLSIDADVVRLSERMEGGELSITIGAKFRRPLSHEEAQRLDIDPGVEPPVQEEQRSASDALDAVLTPMGPAAPEAPQAPRTRIVSLMEQAVALRASDLHVKVGSPVRMRLAGRLMDTGSQIVTEGEARSMALELMSANLAQALHESNDIEFAYTIPGCSRFRCSVYRQRGTTCLALRVIPDHIPTFEELGLPQVCRTLAERPRGLVLVTGPTGSGKTHTLAALVNHINHTRACHILTMEDPIEFLHRDIMAHITQREIGRDCDDFADALKRALRQDPDVILVGEMRDLETTALALTAAETGHLVFATMHTTSAVNTADRIIDVFPPNQQVQIRQQLSDSLQGVLAQILVPRQDEGLALAQEILVANDAVRALIREGKTPQLRNILQTSGKEGMMSLEQSLNDLVSRKVVGLDMAISKANYPKQIEARTRVRSRSKGSKGSKGN